MGLLDHSLRSISGLEVGVAAVETAADRLGRAADMVGIGWRKLRGRRFR